MVTALLYLPCLLLLLLFLSLRYRLCPACSG
jgi:hypothetical protein